MGGVRIGQNWKIDTAPAQTTKIIVCGSWDVSPVNLRKKLTKGELNVTKEKHVFLVTFIFVV